MPARKRLMLASDIGGIVRFELQAIEVDKTLIRALARKLTEEGPGAEVKQLRSMMQRLASGASLMRDDLDLTRSHEEGRKADL